MSYENIIIVPKVLETLESDIFDGTWLEMSDAVHPSPIYRTKDGDDFLLILTNADDGATSMEVIAVADYENYGFDSFEGDTVFPTRAGAEEEQTRG